MTKKEKHNPWLPFFVLRTFADESYINYAMGDLEELYDDKKNLTGNLSAYFWLWKQVLFSIPQFIKYSLTWGVTMFKNYIKISLRNMKKNKGYSFINITGLALGMACFLLISIWIINEISYDEFHKNKDKIYRLNSITESKYINFSSPWPLCPALKDNYPDIDKYTRFWPWDNSLVKGEKHKFIEKKVALADPDFFQIFTFDFIYGTAETALSDLKSLVLTKSTARKYFGNKNPIGEKLYVAKYDDELSISAVIDDIPSNSDFDFKLLARLDHQGKRRMESWEFSGISYILLKDNIDSDLFGKKIKNFYSKFVQGDWDATLKLQPFTEIHLNQFGVPGISKQVNTFSIIALFVLIIAFVNFMNLTTAKATNRSKEVCIRKVSGAFKKQLISQFLGESIIYSIVALIISILLVYLLLPLFNDISGKELTFSIFNLGGSFIVLILFALLSGISAGLYPACILSSFNPIDIIKGSILSRNKGVILRKGLIVFQFTISVALIVCTLIVQQQVEYIKNADIGLKRDAVLNIPSNPQILENFTEFSSDLYKNTGITKISAGQAEPTAVYNGITINWENEDNRTELHTNYSCVDYNYFQTLGMEITQGRSFSKEYSTDNTQACIINEKLNSIIGLENPIGKEIYFGHPAFPESIRKLKVVGVVEDFNFHSFKQEIGPFIFRMHDPYLFRIFIKAGTHNLPETISKIGTLFEQHSPDYPFEYGFLDDHFNEIYDDEIKMAKALNIFALLAIIISCLGLFGLASFTSEQRTKEIGIRKTIGASTFSIILMLTKEFLKLITFSIIIAFPIAYYYMNIWLQEFVYKIEIGYVSFLTAAIGAIMLSVLTISFQAIKAAVANPVESLKYE